MAARARERQTKLDVKREEVKKLYADDWQGLWSIKMEGGGAIPYELQGRFTDKNYADTAIKRYLDRKYTIG